MRLGRDGYIIPLLVGDSAELKRLAEERGYDPSVFTFVDIADEELKNQIIEEYVKLPDTLFKEKALGRRMQDPLYYAMAMQKVGRADVTFAGIDNTTRRCSDRRSDDDWNENRGSVRSPVSDWRISPGTKGAKDLFWPWETARYAPTRMLSSWQALPSQPAILCRRFSGWEPRCAMVCYSTLGSGQGELIDKVTEALRIANEQRPDLAIDGEFQLDAAIVPAGGGKKSDKGKQSGRKSKRADLAGSECRKCSGKTDSAVWTC